MALVPSTPAEKLAPANPFSGLRAGSPADGQADGQADGRAEGPASSQSRRVCFAPTTKLYDGMAKESVLFHEYMRDVFRTVVRSNGETTVSVVARKLDLEALQLLKKMLLDLVQRCERSPLGRAAVLITGGSCAGSVLTAHIPYLRIHAEYLDTVMGKVTAFIERRADRAKHEAMHPVHGQAAQQ
jgi:hypothetical protein